MKKILNGLGKAIVLFALGAGILPSVNTLALLMLIGGSLLVIFTTDYKKGRHLRIVR